MFKLQNIFYTILVVNFLLYNLGYDVEGCTAIGITPEATEDGRLLLAHTDDAGGAAADIRLIPVPEVEHCHRRHGETCKRAVYKFDGGYPRVISHERGIHYMPNEEFGQKIMEPLGFIDETGVLEVLDPDSSRNDVIGVGKGTDSESEDYRPLRYAYFDQDYGLINEMQLSMVETTCGAKTVGWASDVPYGFNLFGIAELSKVALERCISARCAVKVMGELAEKYGFYSEDSGDPKNPGYGDSAEAMVVGDRLGEVWAFHVLTGEKNSSGIWAAQRVPKGHITAIANGFIIREIDFDDDENFLYSKDIKKVAERLKFWDSEKNDKFDFTAVFGFVGVGPLLPLYVGRRVWRIFDIVAPSLQLNPYVGENADVPTYPFSVKPDKPITLSVLQSILKDHYEGTQFDMTQGMEAGPFHNPNRFPANAHVPGGWERPISIFRSMFSFISQITVKNDVVPVKPDDDLMAAAQKFAMRLLPSNLRGSRSLEGEMTNVDRHHHKDRTSELDGILWYGQDKPHGTVWTPFWVGQTRLPHSYLVGMQSKWDFESSWRAFSFVNNWAMLRYDVMSQDIAVQQHKFQQEANDLVANLRNEEALGLTIEEKLNAFAQRVVDAWWDLGWKLVALYSDGYKTFGEKEGEQIPLGYPDWWLKQTSYVTWPGDTYKPPVKPEY